MDKAEELIRRKKLKIRNYKYYYLQDLSTQRTEDFEAFTARIDKMIEKD